LLDSGHRHEAQKDIRLEERDVATVYLFERVHLIASHRVVLLRGIGPPGIGGRLVGP
jgi:hypothetical protein